MKRFVDKLCVVAAAALLCLGCSKGAGTPNAPPGGGSGNRNPTVSINVSDTHLWNGGPATATVTVSASDPDGDQLNYAYTATKGTVTSSGPTATTATFTATQWGSATVTVTVTDGKGGSTSATASMYVRNPNPPAFTLVAVTPSCNNNDAFGLQVTFGENVLLSHFSIRRNSPKTSSCEYASLWNYTPPLNVSANTPYPVGSTCFFHTCNYDYYPYFDIYMFGTRPEPDGGLWVINTTRLPL